MLVFDIGKLIDGGRWNYNEMLRLPCSGDRSWEYCHTAFLYYKGKYTDPQTMLTADEIDILCLHLGWYLASWGMLRNSFLNKHNHKIHADAVRLLLDSKWNVLWDMDYASLTSNEADLIDGLSRELCEVYRPYLKSATAELTDTLKTKILLGTLACVPAYDQYFVNALKYVFAASTAFETSSVLELKDLYCTYGAQFNGLKVHCGKNPVYPSAKLLDMCLFTYGTKTEKTERVVKDELKNKFPNIDFRIRSNKKKLTFLVLYTIHGAAVLSDPTLKEIYLEDGAFYDAVRQRNAGKI